MGAVSYLTRYLLKDIEPDFSMCALSGVPSITFQCIVSYERCEEFFHIQGYPFQRPEFKGGLAIEPRMRVGNPRIGLIPS